jgi:hypothetical protein
MGLDGDLMFCDYVTQCVIEIGEVFFDDTYEQGVQELPS